MSVVHDGIDNADLYEDGSSSSGKFPLFNDIQDALKSRVDWASRQVTFYKLRHQGLRRINKPYPNAADLHFPLVDTMIERIKPFYFQQLYATEQFATFVSLNSQLAPLTSAAASWFDYRLKQKTNLEREIMAVIDFMLMTGRAVLKVSWDTEQKYICFDGVDPSYFIVPYGTTELQDSPWCVHAIPMSKAQYMATPDSSKFNKDTSFVKSITGRGDNQESQWKWDEKARREGLTYGQSDEQIIVWEIYQNDNGTITCDTYSPLQMSKPIRPTFTLSYNHKKFPFVAFRTEIKDKGWYSPRGTAEKNAAFEDSICRLWNGKHDCIDYYNRPLFKNSGDLTNTSVTRFLPGQTLPRGIEPVQQPAPPIDFDQEMQNTRAIAEYNAGVPDLGATQHLTSKPGTRGDVTATQIQAIVGQSSMSDDMRARVFRLDLADLYRMCWSLYKQYDSKSLLYVANDEQLTISPEALQGEYAIMPNGAADSWNKPLQLQKAISRKQMFQGDPYIEQGELDKSILEIDDPRLITRLYKDPGDKLKDQMEEQAQEIVIMEKGFPAQVQQADDDKAHLQCLSGYVEQEMQQQRPIDPLTAQLFIQHGMQHDQALAQKKDPAIGQVRQQMAPVVQFLQGIAQQGQQPSNVVPGPGAPASPGPSTGAPPVDPAKAAQMQQDSATKVMQALAALIKAGTPVTVDEINTAMAQAGLPPLQSSSIQPHLAAAKSAADIANAIQPPQMNQGAGQQ